jgi:D-beta-D-heptose 7-phosphate kinase/D-beta-D-heptose 1-phosphate adenosyltransferase
MTESTAALSRQALQAVLDQSVGREVWVVGDVMLDEYVHGDVGRISPEAPVPVVRVGDVQHRLGGAANVARQVAVLGARAVLAGVVGRDDAGETVIEGCESMRIDVRGLMRDSSRRTTRKLRVLGHGQQLLRLDWEDAGACGASLLADLFRRLVDGRPPDAIILSDYGKGVLTDVLIRELVRFGSQHGCPVLVDPKRRDLVAYRGASLLTPNLGELAAAAGQPLKADDLASVAAAARPFVQAAELDAMVVTLSDRGMLLVSKAGDPEHVPAVRRAVADVTGAGDTAMAVLATTLAGGATLRQAAEIANIAAGLSVAEVGAVSIDPAQISHGLDDAPRGKVLPRADLARRAASWRIAGKRIVFTNGCFDLLHTGHLSLLQEAAKLGDILVLAINSDESVRRLKGPDRPIVPAIERATLLAALSCVDAVTIFDEDTPLETLRTVRPHILVKGQDYSLDTVVGRELVEADGGRVALVPLVADRSTTDMVTRIRRAAAGR